MRTVITVLKASSDVERMGDHAASIAKATIRVKGEERLPEVEAEIKKMGKAVRNMVEEALDVYVIGDEERAYEVAASDEVIDNYLKKFKIWLLNQSANNQIQYLLVKNIFKLSLT